MRGSRFSWLPRPLREGDIVRDATGRVYALHLDKDPEFGPEGMWFARPDDEPGYEIALDHIPDPVEYLGRTD